MIVDRRKIIAFGIAFILGTYVFMWGGQVINPETDLILFVAGIDTDLGATTYDQKGQLAEASWYGTPSTIRVDPDLAGETDYVLEMTGFLPIFLPEGHLVVSHSKSGQPDIIVTITEPQAVLVEDPKDFTTPAGEPFKLYKTIFWVTIKTDADSHADTVVAEIATRPDLDLTFLGFTVEPPVGEVWEGNVFIEYALRHHPDGFIYEVYIDEDPLSEFTRKDLRGTDPNLYAGDVPAIAYPYIESQGAVAFYDAIEGNEIKDFESVRTTRGILPLGAKLGVGANAIIEERFLRPDLFEGWNLLNVYVQYQVAVWVAIPLEDTVDEEGNPQDPDEVISGSQHEDEMGLPQEFRPEVKDREFEWPDLFPEIPEWLKFMIFGLLVVVVIAVILKVILWVMPRKR